ncbi:MAG: Alpha/beta hydrolase fold-3 domain protein [Acidimicrobiales bacterium]|nr:Alpha/beta hydrolase fold-3 domain protein [Acidimicrobiales bacterium]
MALWPEEYEGLREEARQMAEVIRAAFGGGRTPPADRDERVAAQRKVLASLEVTSPAGTDEAVAGVPCRVFRPPAHSRGTYIHFHGGAMMLGGPRMNDTGNAELCERHRITVISVDYRLAPEHPFPAGGDDCLAVAKWVLDHEQGPIILGGESAGGYYAALTLLRIRDELGAIDRISGANLVFGVYDLSGTPTGLGIRPSDVPDILEGDLGEFVLECYLPGRSRLEARAAEYSPLYAHLHDLPPAIFTVGSADHLLDDTLFMHGRWQAYGNDAELDIYPDCIHGFVAFPMELAKRANERIDDFFDRVLH